MDKLNVKCFDVVEFKEMEFDDIETDEDLDAMIESVLQNDDLEHPTEIKEKTENMTDSEFINEKLDLNDPLIQYELIKMFKELTYNGINVNLLNVNLIDNIVNTTEELTQQEILNRFVNNIKIKVEIAKQKVIQKFNKNKDAYVEAISGISHIMKETNTIKKNLSKVESTFAANNIMMPSNYLGGINNYYTNPDDNSFGMNTMEDTTYATAAKPYYPLAPPKMKKIYKYSKGTSQLKPIKEMDFVCCKPMNMI